MKNDYIYEEMQRCGADGVDFVSIGFKEGGKIWQSNTIEEWENVGSYPRSDRAYWKYDGNGNKIYLAERHRKENDVVKTDKKTSEFTVTFPYKCGTKVRTGQGRVGTIACYQCIVNDPEYYTDKDGVQREEHIVMVSGIKEPWCGEELLSTLEILEEVG